MGDTGSREGGEPASMNETGLRPLESNVELGMVLRSRVMEGLEVEGGQGRDGSQGFRGRGMGGARAVSWGGRSPGLWY